MLYISGHFGDTIDEIRLQEPHALFIEKPFTRDDLDRKVRASLEN